MGERKIYYPFGTPIHGKHPYSEYAHLPDDNKSFAVQVSVVVPPKGAKPIIPTIIETVVSPKKTFDQSINDSSKPCSRPDCKEVARKITEMQEKNQEERDNIIKESKKLLVELEQTEAMITVIETEQKQSALDSAQFEKSLYQIQESLKELEQIKEVQHLERDELNNKVMTLEAEKQRWTNKLQRAEETLANMLWKRVSVDRHRPISRSGLKTPVLIVAPRQTHPHIPRAHPKDKSPGLDEPPSLVKYGALVRADVLDYSELPKRSITAAAVLQPLLQLQSQDALSVSSAHRGRERQRRFISVDGSESRDWEGSSLDQRRRSHGGRSPSSSIHSAAGAYSSSPLRLSQKSALSASLSPALRSPSPGILRNGRQRSPLTRPSDGSLILDLPPGAYKGYTPSGGSSVASASRRGAREGFVGDPDGASLSGSMASWQQLDPVFYSETSRVSFGRRDKKGLVRRRGDPPGYRRKLLTATGHPGVFTHGVSGEGGGLGSGSVSSGSLFGGGPTRGLDELSQESSLTLSQRLRVQPIYIQSR